MINLQLAEKPVTGDGSVLDVHSIFATIQGEGPLVGTPAVFVRTAGCNLQCTGCDTLYTDGRQTLDLNLLLANVRLCRAGGLVVVTGGEPMRQPIGRFCRLLLNSGYRVQVETNGTLWSEMADSLAQVVIFVCSPKTGALNQTLMQYISALKYILSCDQVDPTDGLPTSSLDFGVRPARPWPGFRGEVFVQPMDCQDRRQNERNTEAAVASCIKHGYRLCLQTHKELGLP